MAQRTYGGKPKRKEGLAELVKTVVYALAIAMVFRTFLFQPFWIPSGSMKSTLLVGDYLFISKYSYGYSKHSFPWSMGPFNGRIWGAEPERGDVVVFKHPRNGQDYIKRLVGLPGETLQMRRGVLHIDGEPVGMTRDGEFVEELRPGSNLRCAERRTTDGEIECVKERWIETLPGGPSHLVLNADGNAYPGPDNTGEFTVPAGHYFFMGDNRDNSRDSREQSTSGVGFVPAENLIGRAEIVAVSADGPFWEIWNWRFGRTATVIR